MRDAATRTTGRTAKSMIMNFTNTTIGTHLPEHGGHFGGIIQLGDKRLVAIWAPKAQGETKGVWLPTYTDVPAARSTVDSVTNTLAMAEAGSDLAKWAIGLTIGGFTDWVLPARDVLELAYRHLKPTTEETGGYFRDGDNPSSLPPGYPYAIQPVLQTTVEAFQAGGAEAFEDSLYWSSTQGSSLNAWSQSVNDGVQGISNKSSEFAARAVRLIQLSA
jgi:hypothetical protein